MNLHVWGAFRSTGVYAHPRKRCQFFFGCAALIFLELNGVDLDVDEDALVDIVLAVTKGKADKSAVAKLFRGHVRE